MIDYTQTKEYLGDRVYVMLGPGSTICLFIPREHGKDEVYLGISELTKLMRYLDRHEILNRVLPRPEIQDSTEQMIDFKSFDEFEENRPMSIGQKKQLEEFTKAAMQAVVTGLITKGCGDFELARKFTDDIGKISVWIARNTLKALNEEVNKDGSND